MNTLTNKDAEQTFNLRAIKVQRCKIGKMSIHYLIWKNCIFCSIYRLSSLISPSFQGGPTIFLEGIFLQQTPRIKN